MLNSQYTEFLVNKAVRASAHGISDVPELAPHLFPFQRACVEFALRQGSSGCFLSTGLGKTEVQLEFAQKAMQAVGGKALILTPLAVAAQTRRRAERWNYEAHIIRDQNEARSGINICNYDRLDKLDPSQFSIVCMDESSIIKNFTGKMTNALIDAFCDHAFKLCATATPAPNDHMELGTHAEFLGVMQSNEMLSRFFINDTSTASQQWRLKGHAVQAFWDWVSSWARMGELPSDITGAVADDVAFELAPFQVVRHRAKDSAIDRELADLFGVPKLSATTLHDVKRQTIEARAEMAASIVTPDDAWIVWVDTNYEADAIQRLLPDAVEVRGSQSIDEKEQKLEAFATGKVKHIIGKPSMIGFGLDWAHCANMIFVGRSYSYEDFFQAVRRCWRFGQRRTVNVHLVVAEGEEEIGRVIDRKNEEHIQMRRAMRAAMARAQGQKSITKTAYVATHKARLPEWISNV